VKLEAQVELSQAQSAMGQSLFPYFYKKRLEIKKIAGIFNTLSYFKKDNVSNIDI